ncbi:hypothetical protein [Polynucleobacter sp.]|uniref:hypothetical protein n=1 Tax=Polynucleobacter sp. TaxID=2029855 RepID=UPI003F69E817
MPEKNEYKIVEIEGRKFYEKSFSKVFAVSDYGREVIAAENVSREANLPINFDLTPGVQYVMLKGFLNNKLIPGTAEPAKDSYGDIPTGSNVYDIERLRSNPVALVNHENDAAGIAGNFIYLQETAQGLQFKEILRPLDEIFDEDTKDAVSAWGKGWGKAYSIGGRWLYDMENSQPENNTYILVKAILHEASHVAIGADKWALSTVPDTADSSQGKGAPSLTPEEAAEKFLETRETKYLDMARSQSEGK